MKESIGFAIVGLGMGRSRAGTVKAVEGAELIGVCDVDEERARDVSGKFDCDWTCSFEDVLDRDDVEVVYIMLPSGLHGDFAIKAMRSGKHAIVTKPMDVSLEKADAMIATADETGQILAVDFESRYAKHWRQVKRAIEDGLFGKLILGEARLKWRRTQEYYDRSGWRGTWAMDGGGSLANQTIHYIDLLQWLMGDAQEVMAAYCGIFAHDIETEDLGMAMLKFKSGAVGTVLGTTTYPRDHYHGLEIHGDAGGVIGLRDDLQDWRFVNEEQLPPDINISIANAVEDVVSAIQIGSSVAVDGREGRKSLALLQAIYQSARERRSCKILA